MATAIVLLLLALAVGPIGSSTDTVDGRLVPQYHSVLSLVALGGSMTPAFVFAALLAVSAAAAVLYAWALRRNR